MSVRHRKRQGVPAIAMRTKVPSGPIGVRVGEAVADGFFTDPARFTVTVHDGIVTLEGIPGSAVLGANIVDQVRHLEGVVAVRDRFSYPGADGS